MGNELFKAGIFVEGNHHVGLRNFKVKLCETKNTKGGTVPTEYKSNKNIFTMEARKESENVPESYFVVVPTSCEIGMEQAEEWKQVG